MAKEKFYPVEVLVEKMQNGEIGWLDYVNHYSGKRKRNMLSGAAMKASPFAMTPPRSSSL